MKKSLLRRLFPKSARGTETEPEQDSKPNEVVGDCSICLGTLPSKSKTLRCGHQFCSKCVKTLKQSSKGSQSRCLCPLCRIPLNENTPKLLLREASMKIKQSKTLLSGGDKMKNKDASDNAMKEAIQALELCVEMEPSNVKATELLLELYDDPDKKIVLLRRAIEHSSQMSLAHFHYKLGLSLKEKGVESGYKEAVDNLRKAIELSKGVPFEATRVYSRKVLASIYGKSKSPRDIYRAIEEYKRILAEEGDVDISILFRIASCYEKLEGGYKNAIAYYQKTLIQDPYFCEPNLRLADIFGRVLLKQTACLDTLQLSKIELEESYLDCILRAEALAKKEKDVARCQYHVKRFQKNFPSIWEEWNKTGFRPQLIPAWKASRLELINGVKRRTLMPNDFFSTLY